MAALKASPPPSLICNVRAVDDGEVVPHAWILSGGGRILERGTGQRWKKYADGATVVHGDGAYLTAGFVDIHAHGGGGSNHEQGLEAIRASQAVHQKHGTTRSVLSLVAGPVREMADHLAVIAELSASCPSVLGSHLEGPFLDIQRKGAHAAEHLIDPEPGTVDQLLSAARGTLRQVTLDPRRDPDSSAIARFTRTKTRVAVGHTNASYEEAARAFKSGASILTHAFNAMPGIDHRTPGPIVAAIDNPNVFLELILDGDHVHPRVAALLFSAAPGRIVLITDAMAAAGAGDGDYRLGDTSVSVEQGHAHVTGTSTLAGSTLTLDRALRLGIEAGLPPTVVVEALTTTPARALGLGDQLGRLLPGYVDDFVLLDDDWVVVNVFRGEGSV